MASIRRISKSVVRALSHRGSTQMIEPTPWDLQFLPVGPIQKGLLFPKPNPQQDTGNLINHLKDSLARTLDFFPPLAGRFGAIQHGDDTTSFSIDCNNTGALFVHAVADGVRTDDILQHARDPPVCSLFTLNGVKNIEATTKPILGVQVTELDDGIFIGCTVNHSVTDGTSFWHFLNSWSEISRGAVDLSKHPVFERSYLKDYTNGPVRIPNSQLKQIHDEHIPSPLDENVLHFTRESIAKLKAKANAEVGSNKISSLQAILAHVWRSVYRTKQLDPNEEISHGLAFSVRPRLRSMPQEYFGNAVQFGGLTLKARELLEGGLGNVALQMNRTVAAQTEETMSNFLTSWPKSPVLITPGMVNAVNGLFGIGSHRYDAYGNDFGWGRPIALRSGSGDKLNGMMVVCPGVEDGSIEIEACLSPETLHALVNDQDFVGADDHEFHALEMVA
ncbi:hypothetical protein SLE2022_301690 [Rubroshorea leprosula]